MHFVWTALLPIIVSPHGNSSALGSVSRRNKPRSSASPKAGDSSSSPNSSKPKPARDRMLSIAARSFRRAGSSHSRKVFGPGLKAGPAFARCRVRRWPDGAARAVHCRRTWLGRRSVHAASVWRPRREGAAADLGANEGGTRDPQGKRRQAWQSDQYPGSRRNRAHMLTAAADDHARGLLPLLRSLLGEGTISIAHPDTERA